MHTSVNTSRLVTLSAIAALTIGLAGCGSTTGERATSGAGVGAAVGAGAAAVTGGSVTQGAVIGGGVGAATGAATDEEDINLE
ncbi:MULTISPECIES: hypothetical protein [Halomonadaceae]|jgi:hypothetical protein|uniref:Glycine zipper domain-containing protein n=1 Tax=Vreelandella piezotolerans TaxID=2609667 RepID=A0ABQ6X8R1_9GAMM|nr:MULTISPECIES: hypothetical protein [Halomonas]KFC50493.1 hypothetical protein DK37_21135 [Halomonas sp. SUBG004]KAE8437947.1 hypothetical protein F1978_12490 [Halomonas piezotolerans]MCG7576230.1 hypothetical protein [Halomonas sp. MMH1-48]MCG7590480.1 hypothetical protein [Halomonas sp. McD50-5]MCG7603293.1 hypothetical protein [Halomonas sp. MM17-34]|tara:strand:- start:5 stop:253 length:249 start_codon:yes stop_codon:yes gene_type:complete